MRALSRKKATRQSLMRNLATSLVLYEKIKTTTPKAKELKPIVEHLISIGKKNDLTARRRLLSYFFDKNAVKKVLEELVPRYAKLDSGFIRSYKLGYRLGDGAEVTILELIKSETKPEIKEPEAVLKEDKETSKEEDAQIKASTSKKRSARKTK